MKKPLKITLIMLLVVVVVLVTAYVFYSQFTKQKDSFSAVTTYLASGEKAEFNAKVVTANEKSESERFAIFIQIESELNDIANVLNSYLVNAKDYDLEENQIIDELEEAIEVRKSADVMLNEYIKKCDISAPGFSKTVGGNDLYSGLSAYYIEYSEALQTINSELNKVVDKSADVKFSMIEITLNVVVQTLSELDAVNNIKAVKNPANFAIISGVDFEQSYIGDFSKDCYLFIENYNACNKAEFAKNLSTNVNSFKSLNGNKLNDAVYYFRNILGIV